VAHPLHHLGHPRLELPPSLHLDSLGLHLLGRLPRIRLPIAHVPVLNEPNHLRRRVERILLILRLIRARRDRL